MNGSLADALQLAAQSAFHHLDKLPRLTEAGGLVTWTRGKEELLGKAIPTEQLTSLRKLSGFRAGTIYVLARREGSWTAQVTNQASKSIVVRPVTFPAAEAAPLPEGAAEWLAVAWEQARHNYTARPPASEEQLTELADALGFPIPAELEALLRQVNGAERVFGDDDDDDHLPEELLDTRGIAREYGNLREVASDAPLNSTLAYDTSGTTQDRFHHPGWVPFAADGGGNFRVVDLAPGPQGVSGQVLEMGRDFFDGGVLRARSIADLLAGRTAQAQRPTSSTRMVFSEWEDANVNQFPEDATRLILKSFPTLSGINALTSLRGLTLTDAEDLDFSELAEVPLLELEISSALASMDLSTLAGHPKLRSLKIGEQVRVTGLEALAELPALELLNIPEGSVPAAVSALKDHPRISQIQPSAPLPLQDVLKFAQELAGENTTVVYEEFSGTR